MTHRTTLLLLSLSAVLSVDGCATATQDAVPEVVTERPNAPIELGLRTTDGTWLELGDLRGTPLLLFVFATFDTGSQAALTPLRSFVEDFDDIQVLGIAAQPKGEQLVSAWAYALDPPFVVGVDPYGKVEGGTSALGKVELIPTFIVVDADGYERARVSGVQTEGALADLTSEVTGRSRPVR
jgi:peroxiredoxin